MATTTSGIDEIALAQKTLRSRLWTLLMLALVAFFAGLNQQAFVTLLAPIQQDLHASDGAMGFLMGSAFALAFGIFILPVSWLVDRFNRRNIITIAILLWSMATILSGFAGSFLTLTLARLAVGAAETAQYPVVVSMVASLFRAEQRGRAFTVCSVGLTLGFAFGPYAAGLLNDRYSWHAALLVVGGPGILLAMLIYLTVPEPARSKSSPDRPTSPNGSTALSQQFKQCLEIRSLIPFMLGYMLLQGAIAGWLVWYPALLLRVFGFTPEAMGRQFGIIIMFGAISVLLGGPLSDLLAKRGARWRLYFLVGIMILAVPLVITTLARIPSVSWSGAVAFTLVVSCYHPVVSAAFASASPAHLRGFVTGLFYLFAALAAGFTPPLIGIINDILRPAYGDESIRFGVIVSPVFFTFSAFLFWLASHRIDGDTARAEG